MLIKNINKKVKVIINKKKNIKTTKNRFFAKNLYNNS